MELTLIVGTHARQNIPTKYIMFINNKIITPLPIVIKLDSSLLNGNYNAYYLFKTDSEVSFELE